MEIEFLTFKCPNCKTEQEEMMSTSGDFLDFKERKLCLFKCAKCGKSYEVCIKYEETGFVLPF